MVTTLDILHYLTIYQKIDSESVDSLESYDRFIAENEAELHEDHWINTRARVAILSAADLLSTDILRIEKIADHCRSRIKFDFGKREQIFLNVGFKSILTGNFSR